MSRKRNTTPFQACGLGTSTRTWRMAIPFVSRTERTKQHAVSALFWRSSYQSYDVTLPTTAKQNVLPIINIQSHFDTRRVTQKIL